MTKTGKKDGGDGGGAGHDLKVCKNYSLLICLVCLLSVARKTPAGKVVMGGAQKRARFSTLNRAIRLPPSFFFSLSLPLFWRYAEKSRWQAEGVGVRASKCVCFLWHFSVPWEIGKLKFLIFKGGNSTRTDSWLRDLWRRSCAVRQFMVVLMIVLVSNFSCRRGVNNKSATLFEQLSNIWTLSGTDK